MVHRAGKPLPRERIRAPYADAGDYPQHLDTGLLKIAAVCVLAAIMTILDTTVVNVAQRTFINQFGATEAVVAWTMTGYTLALAAVIPLTGWAADRFGTKRLFIGSVVLFTAGSVLCAIASSITLLVTYRVIQGLGGGMLMPLVFTILTREAGPARIGRLTSLLGIPMLIGPVFGPIVGGWLIDSFSWPWIFWINVPIGVISVVLAALVFARDEPTPAESFDFIGMLLLSPGLATFLYGVSSLPQRGTVTDRQVWIPAAVGVVLIVGFVAHARRSTQPLIDLRLFTNPVVSLTNAAMLFFAAAFYGAILLLPSYFQEVFQQTPFQSGIHILPQGLGAALTMPLAGRIMDRRGAGTIVLVGVTLMCTGMGIFSYGVCHQVPYSPTLVVGLVIVGMGVGAAMMPLSAAAVATLRPQQVARGSTLINVNQRVAGSVGTAVMAVILTSQFNHSAAVTAARKVTTAREHAARLGAPVDAAAIPPIARTPGFVASVMHDLSHAYGLVFMVVAAVVALAYVPALLLPRKPLR